MPSPDPLVRRALEATEPSVSTSAGGHLDEATAAAMAAGRLEPAPHRTALAHIMRCAECRRRVASHARTAEGPAGR